MKIDLPDAGGGKIISIEIARKARWEREFKNECCHFRVTVDPMLAYLICSDCDAHLNAIEWIEMLCGEWSRVRQLYESYQKSKEEYDRRVRVKCKNCGEFTRLHL